MTIVPWGKDSVTGAPGFAKAGESIVDEAGTALGGAGAATPSPSTWGSNVETLSADKVLTDSSEVLQVLDPGGADRFVDLPALTTSTPFFVIRNVGTELITLRASNEGHLYVLDGIDSIRVWHDGTDVYVEALTWRALALTLGAPTYMYGGDPFNVGDYFLSNGEATPNGSVILGQQTEHTIHLAGTVDLIVYRVTTTGTVLKLWKNGGVDTTFSAITTSEGVFTPSTTVAIGDQLAIEWDVAPDPGASLLSMSMTPTPAGGFAVYAFGANMGTLSTYQMNGNYNSSSGSQTVHYVASPGVAHSLSWNSSGAASNTDIDLKKNGAVSETIDLTGLTGVVSGLTTAYRAEDTMELTVSAGTAPSTSTMSVLLEGPTSSVASFGGSITNDKYLTVMGSTGSTTSASLTADNQLATPACTIRTLMWFGAAGDIELWQNGSAVRTITVGTSGVVDFPAVSFAESDILAVRAISTGAASAAANLLLEV